MVKYLYLTSVKLEIMKNLLLKLTLVTGVFLGLQTVQAQTPYRTALGVGIDFGDGQTLVGPQIKHNFNGPHAGNAQVLFGDGITTVGVDYSYNQSIAGANGLGWYAGVGPQLSFVDFGPNDETYFAIRPAVGLEYRIPSTPIGMHFDWKPWWNLSHNSDFEAGRFTFGLKFVLK